MPSVKLAFVGSARDVSPWLLQSLGRVGTLEAICNEDAERDAARFHARWAFSDLATLLRETEPAGVVLHQPLELRARLIKQCLAAGAAVLVPGAPGSAGSCKRLGSLCKLSGRFVLAAPAVRFSPAVLLARRLVESGKLGPPISMTVHSTRRGATRTGSQDRGAVPSDQVFEAIDLIHHLIGPVQRVFAVAHDDGALVASLTAEQGVPVGLVFHGSGPAEAVGVEMEIRAADGTRLHMDRNQQLVCGNGSRVDVAHQVALPMADPAVELGYEGLLAEFRRCIQSGRAGLGLVGQVPATVAATEGLFASVARGRVVALKQVSTGLEAASAGSIGALG